MQAQGHLESRGLEAAPDPVGSWHQLDGQVGLVQLVRKANAIKTDLFGEAVAAVQPEPEQTRRVREAGGAFPDPAVLKARGCELEVELWKGRIISTRPSSEGVVNQGQACVKGRFTVKDIVNNPRRILYPLIRKKKELEEVSWEEALDFIGKRLKKNTGFSC